MDKVSKAVGDIGMGCIHDLYGYADINNQLQKYIIENTRLGIPAIFSEEALHGLVRPGCTVFPHAISQAATWDPGIVEKIGKGIAAETRSFGIHETFGPVLDLAREPRWGRTEETYGEDTYLSSRMAVSMVKGLQGDGLSSRTAIAAEPKHFAVHGIPEGGLNTSHCSIGMNEMFTFYMPVFEAAFTEGGAINAMCSYNAIDGVPCPANHYLLTDILRDAWKMPGFVRSDLGAVARLQRSHFTADSGQEAIRQALEAGVDMQYYDYPHDMYQDSIVQMAEKGIISMETLDTAVGRVLGVKFMLGLFDDPYTDAGLSITTVRSEKHGEIALNAAREGICLLENKGNLLPLNKYIKRIAVIGPSADTARLGDYTPYVDRPDAITILQGVKDIVSPETVVTYTKGTGILEDELDVIAADYLTDGNGNQGLLGRYFNNPGLDGEPAFLRLDPQINFNWVIAKPDERITTFNFSVRWTGKLVSDRSGPGYIGIASQDSMRLYIDGQMAVNGWRQTENTCKSVPFIFEAGREYDVCLEYCKDVSGVEVIFGWNTGSEGIAQAADAAKEADVAILALGDSGQTCGEGHDRSDMNLPGRQLDLLKAVHSTGVPIVLALQNGRPITLNWKRRIYLQS